MTSWLTWWAGVFDCYSANIKFCWYLGPVGIHVREWLCMVPTMRELAGCALCVAFVGHHDARLQSVKLLAYFYHRAALMQHCVCLKDILLKCHWLSAWSLVRSTAGQHSTQFGGKSQTWLILPVVICLSQRLSHACLSISF